MGASHLCCKLRLDDSRMGGGRQDPVFAHHCEGTFNSQGSWCNFAIDMVPAVLQTSVLARKMVG